MGATLRYAKVVDRDHAQAHGGLTPATDNVVALAGDAPAAARDFLVLRAWDVDAGGFEETWRIEDSHGHAMYRGTPRTVLPEHGDVQAELDIDAVRSSLSQLTGRHDLVQELTDADGNGDHGPRYRVKARP